MARRQSRHPDRLTRENGISVENLLRLITPRRVAAGTQAVHLT